MSDDLFDITRNRHGGNEFSEEAFESIKHGLSAQREKVLSYVARSDGVTCDQAAYALGMLQHACSARFSELKRDKAILPLMDPKTGKQVRNKTKTGKSAGVWVAA